MKSFLKITRSVTKRNNSENKQSFEKEIDCSKNEAKKLSSKPIQIPKQANVYNQSCILGFNSLSFDDAINVNKTPKGRKNSFSDR